MLGFVQAYWNPDLLVFRISIHTWIQPKTEQWVDSGKVLAGPAYLQPLLIGMQLG